MCEFISFMNCYNSQWLIKTFIGFFQILWTIVKEINYIVLNLWSKTFWQLTIKINLICNSLLRRLWEMQNLKGFTESNSVKKSKNVSFRFKMFPKNDTSKLLLPVDWYISKVNQIIVLVVDHVKNSWTCIKISKWRTR